MNSQPSSDSTRATVRVGGGAPADDDPYPVAAGDLTLPGTGRGEHRVDDRGRRAHDRHAVLGHPSQDLGTVDLAQDDLPYPQRRHRERHAPSVGVEHGERVQVDVPVRDPRVQGEGHRVHPDVAVRDLYALGAGGRTAGVIDGRGGVLVRLPGHRFGAEPVQLRVRGGPEGEPVLAGDSGQPVRQLRVDEDDARPRVVDDVVHLVRRQPEVDRHQDPPETADAEERGEQPCTVGRDHRHPSAMRHAERVEPGGLGARQLTDPPVRQPLPGLGRLLRLVDDADPVGVHGRGAVQKITGPERDDHHGLPKLRRCAATIRPRRGRLDNPVGPATRSADCHSLGPIGSARPGVRTGGTATDVAAAGRGRSACGRCPRGGPSRGRPCGGTIRRKATRRTVGPVPAGWPDSTPKSPHRSCPTLRSPAKEARPRTVTASVDELLADSGTVVVGLG